MAEENEGDKQIAEMVKLQMEQNQKRVEGVQGMIKAQKEGFAMMQESNMKASASRDKIAARSSSDGTDLSKEMQKEMGG